MGQTPEQQLVRRLRLFPLFPPLSRPLISESRIFFYLFFCVSFLLVSLQDINMRKAFKSSTTQDQQVVSKSSVPNPVREMYNVSDKPPPLSILSTYRCASV